MISYRQFCTMTGKSGRILKAKTGDVVLYPPRAVTSFTGPIAKVGLDALNHFIPEYTESDRLRNVAQYKYINVREKLLSDYKQYWAAVSSNGSLFIGLHEEVVRAVAEDQFHTDTEDYYMDCLGSEVLMEAVMDTAGVASSTDQNDGLVRKQAVAAVRGSGCGGMEESFDEGEVASVDEDAETDSLKEENN